MNEAYTVFLIELVLSFISVSFCILSNLASFFPQL